MGIVLWELLARRRLFKGDGEAETLNKVMNDPIPKLTEVNPDVHPALEVVVMKALDRDMDARFPTAAAFSDALEAAATEARVLGSHRDVATHLDSVIGTDISQQRDAVRAWLARSEPSKHGDPRLDGPNSARKSGPRLPSEQASLTRIEGGARTSKIASDGKSQPDLEATISQPSTSMPLPVPNALGEVSSVSSAILSVADSPAIAPPPVTVRIGKSRTPLVAIIVVLLLVIVGGGLFAMKKINAQATVAAQPPAADTSHTPVAAVDTSVAVASAAAQGEKIDASVAGTTTSSAAASASSPTDHIRHGGHGHGSTNSQGTASPSSMPDDISHNPYR
jgi:serine/threonine-protein kinase